MKRYLIIILTLFATASVPLAASAQRYPERSLVRRGNRAYDRGQFEKSIERYSRALEAAPDNWEARYDSGNALAAAQRTDKAEEMLRAAAADTLRNADDRAEAYFNLGNVQLSQQKLQEALESYKNSLRMNPADEEAKYNYVYVKRLLQQQEQEQQQQQQNDNDQNQNQQQQNDNNDKGDNDENKDNSGDNGDNGDENPDNGGDDDGHEGEEQEVPAEPRISEQEQERMLEAIQAEEDKTQDKLKDKVRGVVVRGRKNW